MKSLATTLIIFFKKKYMLLLFLFLHTSLKVVCMHYMYLKIFHGVSAAPLSLTSKKRNSVIV